MQTAKFSPSSFGGTVHIPPSKSFAHRGLICGALCGGGVEIRNVNDSRDMEATLNFISALGMQWFKDGNTVKLGEQKKNCDSALTVNCIESGSTLRFVIPIMAALGVECEFVGEGRLPSRPIGIYSELLPQHGVSFEGNGLPCKIKGKLTSGDFSLPGNISSQFISGLMFALPILDGDSRIIITTELESESYLNITLSVLKEYGIEITRSSYGYFVKGGQSYRKHDYTVEGDWSQAAFFMNIGAFSKDEIRIAGLNKESVQGDKKCLEVYRKMGVESHFEDGILVVSNPKANERFAGLNAININASDIPDMVPALAVCLALCEGRSVITGAARLRIKESDRLKAVADMVAALGGKVTELDDGLIIEGAEIFASAKINGCNDHRIVMAAATAAARCGGDVFVTDPHSVNKSYPAFYQDYNNIGGKANVINLG